MSEKIAKIGIVTASDRASALVFMKICLEKR